ncbi:unnamed protein product [Orchesella dallaii]|uniref:Protein BRICK1-B n=1 Tax=Orchesella dallaii TaxID=48710 RepID=A0ABP1QNF4_9HEXA
MSHHHAPPNMMMHPNHTAPSVSSGSSTPSSMLVVTEDFQKQIQQDWANREYIEVITGSIKRICDFLNSFDLSCRSRLALLNERLSSLERKIEYLEAWISKGETLP